MLTSIHSQSLIRTGRSQANEIPAQKLSRIVIRARESGGRGQTVNRFSDLLQSQQATASGSRGAEVASRSSTSSNAFTLRSQIVSAEAGLTDPEQPAAYRRGESSLPPMGLPMQTVTEAPPRSDVPSVPMHPVYNVPMVSQESLDAYIHPLQLAGSVQPDTVGTNNNAQNFASNVYRVPDWGLQDFVTSDGKRHRFDVEIVFIPTGATSWNGLDTAKIHPEVASFVLENLRAAMAAEGIPESAVKSMDAVRLQGGANGRSWYLDQIQLVSSDGRTMYPSLNGAMRDPQHTIERIMDFLYGDIPT